MIERIPALRGPGAMRRRRIGAVGVILLSSVALLSACSSSGSTRSTTASSAACQNVTAVLSDGPDPDADPVGYAQAQILPLKQVHTSDQQLATAINALMTAYQDVVSTNGGATATKAETKASNQLNALCPGAAP
jgi:hypothetical protein